MNIYSKQDLFRLHVLRCTRRNPRKKHRTKLNWDLAKVPNIKVKENVK